LLPCRAAAAVWDPAEAYTSRTVDP
jgi:hypothetical protein